MSSPDTSKLCHVSPHERRLRAFLAAVFASNGLLLPGAIVDCGAEKGGEACWLADQAPLRRVHAIEPLAGNLMHVRRYHRRNIIPLLGGLGSVERSVDLLDAAHTRKYTMLLNLDKAKASRKPRANTSFPVFRLDGLFARAGGAYSGERVAFGHFDVQPPVTLRTVQSVLHFHLEADTPQLDRFT